MNQSDEMPTNNYFEAPGCEVIVCSPNDKAITAKKAAAILMRLPPETKIQFWIKILN